MNNRKESIQCLQICLSILLLIAPCLVTLATASVQITIVKSTDNSYYDQTEQALTQQLGAGFQLSVINTDALVAQKNKLLTSDVIVTLGIDAALKTSEKITANKIISAYITLKQQRQYQAKLKNQTVVLLNQPLSRYIAFASLMLKPKSIGIINQKKLTLNKRQNKTLKQFNLDLRQYELQTQSNPLTTVRRLLKHNDVHLILPEKSIYNRDTLKGIFINIVSQQKNRSLATLHPM